MKRNINLSLCAVATAAATIALSGCTSSSAPSQSINVAELAAHTTKFQRDILADGVVTRAEYERAVLAQRQCVQDAGATPSEVRKTANNELAFDYDVTAETQADVNAINKKAELCLGQYLDKVGEVWAYEQLLSPQELAKQLPEVRSCVVDVGISLAANASATDIYTAIQSTESQQKAQPCVAKFPGFFSVAPPADGKG